MSKISLPNCSVLSLITLFCASFSAEAIVDANSKSNTNAPPDGSPWANVGMVNGASGIYLAAGWALTAWHVGPGDFTVVGITLTYDGTYHRLTNSDGTSTDMVMFHLAVAAPVPSLSFASSPPNNGSVVTYIGCGHIAATGPSTIGSCTGFTWSPEACKAWGNNKVTSVNYVVDAGLGKVTLFRTDFNAVAQTSDECQGTDGDSGGGVFQKNGQTWQLVGMIDLIGTVPNQPTSASVYSQTTLAAQISTYRNQIVTWLGSIPPELSIHRTETSVNVCWPDPGISYTLETSPILSTPTWNEVTQAQVITNGLICVSLPPTNNARFFRLRK